MPTEVVKGVIRLDHGSDTMPYEMGYGYALAPPRYTCLICGVRLWEPGLVSIHVKWHGIGTE